MLNLSELANHFNRTILILFQTEFQIEFYLSDANIRQDKFIKQLLKDDNDKLQDRKFIALDAFMKFNRIKQLTSDVENVKIALADSKVVELSEDETSVRRKFPINNDKDVDACTIYVEKLPDAVDHDWLGDLFSSFGRVDHVSLPRFKNNKQIMGFAFVEFDNQRSASRACNFFSFLDSHRPDQKPAEDCASGENESRTLIDKLLDNLSVTEINSMNDRIDQQTAGAEAKNENKRSADEAFGDETAKRFKTQSDSQSENFGSLLEDLKNKYQQDVGQLTNLRVISKSRWIAYKKEYLHLKKKQNGQGQSRSGEARAEMAGTSGSENRRKNEKKKELIEFGSGLIVKLEYTELTGGQGVFKRELRSLAAEESSIAYIDVQTESNRCYLRFKEAQSALDYLQNDRLNAFGKAVLLEGEEEQAYWAFIKQGLVNKRAKQKEKAQRLKERKEQMKKSGEEEEMEHQPSQQDSDRHSAREQANQITNYEKGLIIKLQMDIDLNNEPSEQELRKRIKTAANNSYIGYIDLDTSVFNLFLTSESIRKTCFIRCKTAELATKVLDGEEFKALGESVVLEGEEEYAYWQRVKECSMRKHQSKKSKR